MTKLTLSPNTDIDTTTAINAQTLTGLIAGEDLGPASAVRISADFKVYKAVAGDVFAGICSPRKRIKAGQPVTIFGRDTRFHAVEGGLDGSKLYGLSSVAREIDDAATTPVFRAVSPTDLEIIHVGKTSA